MPPPLEDFFAELQAVEAWERSARRAESVAASMTPQQAMQASIAARLYPGIRGGPLLALARSGYRADHPMMAQVAELSERLNMRTNPHGVQYGDTVGGVIESENKREANRARVQYESEGPRWAQGDRDLQIKLNQAEQAGLMNEQGFLEAPEDEDDPKSFVFNEVVKAFADKGVELPFVQGNQIAVRRQTSEPHYTPESANELIEAFRANAAVQGRTEEEAVAAAQARIAAGNQPRLETVVLEDFTPDEGSGGPSFFQQVGQRAGMDPSSAQNTAMAGLGQGMTDAVRGAFIGMDAPVQEVQGQVRNLYSAFHGDNPNWLQPQSDLGVIATTPLGFEDTGNGFFIDQESLVAQERRQREAQRGQIAGHNVTLGRWIADELPLVDPDTKPFMILSGVVDAGVQLADPTSFALGKVSKGRAASRLFTNADEAAGGLRGLRWLTRPTHVGTWLDSGEGAQALAHFATERSPYNIWRASNRKMPISVASELASSRTADEARAILEPHLGRDIREVATANPFVRTDLSSDFMQRTIRDPGPIKVMPVRGRIDAHDQDLVAWEIEATLKNAHATDATIRTAVDRVAEAKTPIQLNAAIRRTVDDDLDGILALSGVDERFRTNILTLHQQASEEMSSTFTEHIVRQGPTDSPLMVGGETVSYPGAHLINEHAPRWMSLPDPRAIRALTSRMPHVFGQNMFVHADGTARAPIAAMDWFQNQAWKPFQLMRAAWTVRVIGEEQVRMAAAGYDSMFKNPLSYIAWRVGREAKGKEPSWIKHPFSSAADRAPHPVAGGEAGRRGLTDLHGDFMHETDEFQAAMAHAHGGWVDRGLPGVVNKRTFYKGVARERDRFNESWGSEMIRLWSDPVASNVVKSSSLDDVKSAFWNGNLSGYRRDLLAAHPEKGYDTRALADEYIDTVQRRIDNATGGNADLLESLRTGRFNDTDMLAGTSMNTDLPAHLDNYHDDFAPVALTGTDDAPSATVGSRYRQAVDSLFGVLMTNRTNQLSRSPLFKQTYWNEVERLTSTVSAEAKDQLVAQARSANLGRKRIKAIQGIEATGTATLDEVDVWAKAHALDETKEMLYDLTRRGRTMDAMRLVFPFGEAWSEVMTRWLGRPSVRGGQASYEAGLLVQNPKSIRRFQQGMQGARGEGFGEVMGSPEGEGFFWKNEFGEEVFVIPGTRLLTDATLGVPIPMVGTVQGLSMFGSLVPGVGPALQLPTAWILKEKPGPKWMKGALQWMETAQTPLGTPADMLSPFGAPGVNQDDFSEATNPLSYMPPWMRAGFDFITQGDGNETQYGNTVNSIASYLMSTGRYDGSRADLQQLMEDSAHEARWFTFIKALAATTSPTSPQPDYLVVTRDDKTVRLRAMAEDYREMQADDYESADQRFLERYGPNMLAAVQPDSMGVEYAVPTTIEGVQWVMDNPGVEGELPHTYGFFAPQGGTFDYSLYSQQFRDGDRVALDPETYARLMSNTKADTYFNQARRNVEGHENTAEGRAYLAEIKEQILGEYPTWGDASRMGVRPETDVLVRELIAALDNDAAMATEAGQGLRAYLGAREQVMRWQEDEGFSRSDGLLSSARATQAGHDYLREVSAEIINEYPEFQSMYDIVFSRELRDPDA